MSKHLRFIEQKKSIKKVDNYLVPFSIIFISLFYFIKIFTSFNPDEGQWYLYLRQMTKGLLLYKDLFYVKGPLHFFIGNIWRDPIFLRFLMTIFTLSTIYPVFKILRRHIMNKWILAAALLFIYFQLNWLVSAGIYHEVTLIPVLIIWTIYHIEFFNKSYSPYLLGMFISFLNFTRQFSIFAVLTFLIICFINKDIRKHFHKIMISFFSILILCFSIVYFSRYMSYYLKSFFYGGFESAKIWERDAVFIASKFKEFYLSWYSLPLLLVFPILILAFLKKSKLLYWKYMIYFVALNLFYAFYTFEVRSH